MMNGSRPDPVINFRVKDYVHAYQQFEYETV